jgi:hypothetical protein
MKSLNLVTSLHVVVLDSAAPNVAKCPFSGV